MPKESLTLEWFYMTFHKSESEQFFMTGRQLVDETIESVTEYFKSLYNIKKSNGKLKLQLEKRDRKKLEAQRRIVKHKYYDDKMRNMADKCHTSCSRNYRDDRNRDRGYKTSRDNDYKRNKFERKAPTEFSGKPCHIHGDKATTTTESAIMTHTITMNATSVAKTTKTSLQTIIVCQSRATMKERNRAQAAETASTTKKITMLILVKYLEKRGRSVWFKGPHLVRRIFEMRSHLIPRSM
jgi:hypothetical protein